MSGRGREGSRQVENIKLLSSLQILLHIYKAHSLATANFACAGTILIPGLEFLKDGTSTKSRRVAGQCLQGQLNVVFGVLAPPPAVGPFHLLGHIRHAQLVPDWLRSLHPAGRVRARSTISSSGS
jgi:hypothetical protein